MSLDKAAREVLRHYPLPVGSCQPLGNHGGFSGARIWRVSSLSACFCLRAWPEAGITAVTLREIHSLLRQAEDLPFVPRVLAGRHQQTVFLHEGRLWDLTTWLPGRADFHERPTMPRLQAACTALAQLHLAWTQNPPRTTAPCPAIHRRLERAQAWSALLHGGWRPDFDRMPEPISSWSRRAWQLVQARASEVAERLTARAGVPVITQP